MDVKVAVVIAEPAQNVLGTVQCREAVFEIGMVVGVSALLGGSDGVAEWKKWDDFCTVAR
jgi:hypothetical protein